MMPLGESFKNTLYYKNEDGEYKEIKKIPKFSQGGILKCPDKQTFLLSNQTIELGFDFRIKTISRKKFKKMLMGKQIQRNEAEKILNEVWKQKKYFTLIDLMKY